MSTEYNRTMCEFCPGKADCDRLRTEVNCSACPASLTCAAESAFGSGVCIEKHKEWLAGIGGSSCVLTEGLLGSLEKDAISQAFVPYFPSEPKEGDPEPVVEEPSPLPEPTEGSSSVGIRVTCPRCMTTFANVNVSYNWDMEAALLSPLGNGGAIKYSANFKCAFCELVLKHSY